jgi:hypothetical protein
MSSDKAEHSRRKYESRKEKERFISNIRRERKRVE